MTPALLLTDDVACSDIVCLGRSMDALHQTTTSPEWQQLQENSCQRHPPPTSFFEHTRKRPWPLRPESQLELHISHPLPQHRHHCGPILCLNRAPHHHFNSPEQSVLRSPHLDLWRTDNCFVRQQSLDVEISFCQDVSSSFMLYGLEESTKTHSWS